VVDRFRAGAAPQGFCRSSYHERLFAILIANRTTFKSVQDGARIRCCTKFVHVAEAPTISIRVGNDPDFVLRENRVSGIEVLFSRAGVGHAGFENNIIATAAGSKLLSRTPMSF
jgi:hypothetical protein